MSILLSTLGVAFAAFCVWLTVRIVNRRERWTKWTLATVVGLPVLYVASFGPACWAVSRTNSGALPLAVIYDPILNAMSWAGRNSMFATILDRYSRLGAAPEWMWMQVDLSSGETAFIWVSR